MENANIYVKQLDGGKIPIYKTNGSAGADLYAPYDIIIKPSETILIPTNLYFRFDKGIEVQIRPRSGLSLNTHLRLANSVGTIDSDYCDIVGIILENTFNFANLPYMIMNDISILKDLNYNYKKVKLIDYLLSQNVNQEHLVTEKYIQDYIGNEYIYLDKDNLPYGTIKISKGDRIAQMVVNKYCMANFLPLEKFNGEKSERIGGFGSTGI